MATAVKFKYQPVASLKTKLKRGPAWSGHPSLAIGTVTTLPSGSEATASITGTPPDFTLNLGLPVGAGAIDEPRQISGATATIADDDLAVAIVRSSPSTTTLQLGSVANRARKKLPIVDQSSSVSFHTIMLLPAAGEKIMRQDQWPLYSNEVSLAGITLHPSVDLNGWWIAP